MRSLIHKLSLIALLACGGHEDYGPDTPVEVEPEPISNIETKSPPTALNCPKGTHLSFKNIGKSLLASYCTMCHSASLTVGQRGGAPEAVNLDSAQDVALWRALILDRIKPEAKTPMPPGKNLTKTDRQLFEEWLNCGAPE